MKKKYVILLLISLCSSVCLMGQNPVPTPSEKMSDIIYGKMEKVLENAGVLVPVDKEVTLKKWQRNANQAMRNNFRKEFIPLDDSYGTKTYKYLLPNWDLTYFGSTLFTTNKFSAPATLQIPLLPIVGNNKQFNISSSGKFNLFYTMTEFTNMAVNVDVDADAASYVHASLKSGLKYAKQDTKSFDVSSGLFENQLTKIFSDARVKTLSNKADFFPLYLIWQLYANKIIDASKPYYAIKSINAVVWNRDDRSSFNNHTDVEAALKAESPTLPFLRAKMSSNGQWSTEKEKRTEFSIYDIYIIDEPEMSEVVTPDQIYKLWNSLADDYNRDNGITLSPTGKNMIELTFGPVSDPIQLEFTYNPRYFTGVATDLFNEVKELRLILGNPVEKQSLSKLYNITFNADAKMVPRITTANSADPSTNLKDGKYAWSFDVDYSFLPDNSEILPTDILKKNISFTHSQNKILVGPGYLLKAYCARDANINTRFNCSIELKDPQSLLSASEDYLSGEMTLNTTVRNKENTTAYTRKLPIVLRGIQPPTQIKNDVVSLTTPDQIALFFNKQKIVNGKTYQDLVKENSDGNNVVDYNKIGDLLIKAFNFTRDTNSGKYLISSEFIDINNYLSQQKAKLVN